VCKRHYPNAHLLAATEGTRVRYGVTMFITDRTMTPAAVARAAEDRGFGSLYVPEHTHIPTSRRTPPPTGDAELAEEYKRTLDPLVALTSAAGATDRLMVGTGIMLVAQRDPIVTAKAVATLDQISGGRFVLGIGFGWNADELEDHGVTMKERRAVVRERVLAMRALWRDDVASFDGDHVHIPPSWSWPKPAQAGGPAILIGGAAGPILFAHVAEYADGWIPIGGRGVRAALPDLHRACEAAGRDPGALRIVPFGTVPDPGKLEYYESIGVTEVVLRLPSADDATVLRILDRDAALLAL
jgi:probable F420-dependent oxidoreductase